MNTFLICTLAIALTGLTALAGDVEAKAADNGWDRKLFDYVRPAKMSVEQTTPTDAEMGFWLRPPQLETNAPDPHETGPAAPRPLGNADIIHLLFRDAVGDLVPAILCTPRHKAGPFPLVIAIHGLTSNKAQVCGQLAPSLLKRGYAVLAADLPCHGERPGQPLEFIQASNWHKSFPLYRKALIDNRQLIDLASQLPQLDVKSGVVVAGYSLGSWVSSVVGPCDDRVKAMVLMVGGAHNLSPAALNIPQVLAVDPRAAIAHFAGRPLLLLNGKNDSVVLPEWSNRLFAACPEPKQQVWFDSGHLLPTEAYEQAADWIARQASPHQKRAG